MAAALWSPTAQAQQQREVDMRLDSVTRNVCGSKTFQMALNIGDVPVSDSLYGARIVLSWDRTTVELDDFVVAGSNTLGGQFSEPPSVYRDRANGILYIEFANLNSRPVSGSGKPLLFIQGRITAPDTVDGGYGWVDIVSAEFTTSVQYNPLLRFAGLVRVVRDTTAAYTGSLVVESALLGTREDTTAVMLRLDNVVGRRVREIHAEAVVSGGAVRFIDTATAGTLYRDRSWVSRSVEIQEDTVRIDLVDTVDLATAGDLIALIVERGTDSATEAAVRLTRFTVNTNSCLGKLIRSDGVVALQQRERDSGVGAVGAEERGEEARVVVEESGLRLYGVRGVSSIEIRDIEGRRVFDATRNEVGTEEWRVEIGRGFAIGTYLVVLRGHAGAIYRKFRVLR